MTRSYSHTCYPYDNACIESFHSLIKCEWLNRFTIRITDMLIHWSSNISKPFTTLSVYTVIATTCHLMTTKNCIWGLRICLQLSWQNLSFYFVLNLDAGPSSGQQIKIIIYIFICFALRILNHELCILCNHIIQSLRIQFCVHDSILSQIHSFLILLIY